MKFWSEPGRRTVLRLFATTLLCAGIYGALSNAEDYAGESADLSEALTESYREVPIPPEFHVEATPLEGPVFADSNGRTLYKWPQHKLRNGYSGEAPDTPACYDEVLEYTKERVVQGGPLAGKQLTQEKLVFMLTEIKQEDSQNLVQAVKASLLDVKTDLSMVFDVKLKTKIQKLNLFL